MSPRSFEFAELSYLELERLQHGGRAVVLLLPVGCSEPHGPHAPLGTDLLISRALCRRIAERLAGDAELLALILPPVPYGVTRYARSFAGAVSITESTLRSLLVELCGALIEQGWRRIMVINNHFEPAQVRCLHQALDQVEATTGMMVGFLDLTRRERAVRLTEEFRRAHCHAGRYETSLVLAEAPELIALERMRELPPVEVDLAAAIAAGRDEFRAMGLAQAYAGAPARASAEEGEAIYTTLSEMAIELIRELAQGRGGRDRPGRYGRSPGADR
jgi:creatinine amidohydrolase